jgi:hypothetical protein
MSHRTHSHLRRASACLLASIVASASVAAQTTQPAQPRFDRSAWQSDYAQLKTELEQRYANLAWFASPQGGVDLPALDRYTRASLAIAGNDDQAALVLADFARSFRDDHFSALPMVQSGTAEKEPPKAALTGLDAVAGCAALGYTSDVRMSFSAPFESLPGFRLDADGVSSAFRAGEMELADGHRLGLVRIRYFRQNQSSVLCVTAWNALQVPDKAIDADALAHAVEEAWYAELAARLKRFHEDAVAAVLVDIGQNNGGNDSGDAAARMFSTGAVHSSRLLVSQSAEAGGYFDEQIGEMQDALKLKPSDAIAAALRASIDAFELTKKDVAKACAMDWVWKIRRDWSANTCRRLLPAGTAGGPSGYLAPTSDADNESARRLHWPLAMQRHWGAWSGPVYLLTDAKTYSAAEMFSAVMRDNHVARTVGDTTGRAGCGFMIDAKPVVLAHSRLRFRIPNCVRLRADGSDEVAGIAPDLPVLPIEGESKRAWAMRILTTIGTDLSAQGAVAAPPRAQ